MKKFRKGEIIVVRGNTEEPEEYAVIISKKEYEEYTENIEDGKYEAGTFFYKTSQNEVDFCTPSFLRVTNYIEKSSLEKALSYLETKEKSIKEKLKFFKSLAGKK